MPAAAPYLKETDMVDVPKAEPEDIAAAWDTWHKRHGGKLGPGPAFVEAINAAFASLSERERRTPDVVTGQQIYDAVVDDENAILPPDDYAAGYDLTGDFLGKVTIDGKVDFDALAKWFNDLAAAPSLSTSAGGEE